MQNTNAPGGAFPGGRATQPTPGLAQSPAASRIDADIAAIRELQECIQRRWETLAAASREQLRARLDLLGAAADDRATDSRPVREALQAVLLSVGTGAMTALSEPSRERLAALTGIELPDRLYGAQKPQNQTKGRGNGPVKNVEHRRPGDPGHERGCRHQ
jgi:hypothetical protein